MSDIPAERRYFSRVLFSSQACLVQGQQHLAVNLIDISLKGALIQKPIQWQASDLGLQLKIELEENGIEIVMNVQVTHDNNTHLGLKCTHIDIDSISHLRRLIELNTGDESLLQRELEQLMSQYN